MDICPHFGVCGGCSHQDLSYPEQLKIKENKVKEHLEGLAVQQFHSIQPSPEIHFYRNKMEYSFGDLRDLEIYSKTYQKKEKGNPITFSFDLNQNKAHLGLHPKRRFNVVTPTPECQLLSKEAQHILNIVAHWATNKKIPTFTRHNGAGILRHLVIREGKNTGERLVNLVAKSGLTEVEELCQELKQSGVPISTLIWTVHDGLSDVARSEDMKVIWGEGLIQEKFGEVNLRVPPNSFMQTNTHAFEGLLNVLRNWIRQGEECQGEGGKTLLDLFCGSGVIGLNLAVDFERVIGIELDEPAVSGAKQNALLNNISNIEFITGFVEKIIPELTKQLNINDTFVVVDPPRPGLHPKLIQVLNDHSFPVIAYVSCNPASLGRDLRLLSSKYRIEHVKPFDFFPHTEHIETLVILK